MAPFQGAETSPEGRVGAGNLAIDFSLGGTLAATHVHIDYVGRVLYLLKGSTPARLLLIVLKDASKLCFICDQKQVERYLKVIKQHIVVLSYKQWLTLIDTQQSNARITLESAGSILGSACIGVALQYLEEGEKKLIVFSSELGTFHVALLSAPKTPYKAYILAIESTYGNRLHEDRRSSRERLEKMLEPTRSNQGAVLILAFSIDRTQGLLCDLEDIIHRIAPKEPVNKAQSSASSLSVSQERVLDWASLPITLDFPLAGFFTTVYRDPDRFGAEASAYLAQVLQGAMLIKVLKWLFHCRVSTSNRDGSRHLLLKSTDGSKCFKFQRLSGCELFINAYEK